MKIEDQTQRRKYQIGQSHSKDKINRSTIHKKSKMKKTTRSKARQILKKQIKNKKKLKLKQKCKIKSRPRKHQFRQREKQKQQPPKDEISLYKLGWYLKIKEYKFMLAKETNQIQHSREQNQKYKNDLKRWIYQCYLTILHQIFQAKQNSPKKSLNEFDEEEGVIEAQVQQSNQISLAKKDSIIRSTKYVWEKVKQFYFEIINTENINLIQFKLDNDNLEVLFRKMMIQTTLMELIAQHQKLKKNEKLSAFDPYTRSLNLSQLSIQKSSVLNNKDSVKIINQVIATIKASWYIRQLYLRYFFDLKDPQIKQIQEKKENQIKRIINELSINFIDYAYNFVNGVSHAKYPYAIFINLFKFHQQSKGYRTTNYQQGTIQYDVKERQYQKYEGNLKIFITIVLAHELAHTLSRSLGIVMDGAQSTKSYQEKDGGDKFEDYAFNGKAYFYLPTDYNQIQQMLLLKEAPSIKNIESLFPAKKITDQRPQNKEKAKTTTRTKDQIEKQISDQIDKINKQLLQYPEPKLKRKKKRQSYRMEQQEPSSVEQDESKNSKSLSNNYAQLKAIYRFFQKFGLRNQTEYHKAQQKNLYPSRFRWSHEESEISYFSSRRHYAKYSGVNLKLR